MKDSVLIFDKSITGHNLEYVNHLYGRAAEKQDKQFVFAIPETFSDRKDKLVWPEAQNASFYFLNKNDCKSNGGLRQVILDVLLLRKLIRSYNVKTIFFINWISMLVILLLPLNVKVSGISYNIYLYNWHSWSLISKMKSIFKTLMLVLCPQVSRIFVLNDRLAAAYLNKLYHTQKFAFLPDPINIPQYEPKNIRKEMGIADNKKLFLLFGTLSERKGTLCVLRSLLLLNQEEKDKYYFVLAGSVDERIKEEFYNLYAKIKQTSIITVFDKFCDFELIADLCYSCDTILIPYLQTSNSSGVVGYAAYYQKTVIAPASGLIGRIVRNYSLGHRLIEITPEKLRAAYAKQISLGSKSLEYIHTNDIKTFTNTILS